MAALVCYDGTDIHAGHRVRTQDKLYTAAVSHGAINQQVGTCVYLAWYQGIYDDTAEKVVSAGSRIVTWVRQSRIVTWVRHSLKPER